jgi:hypothetical protein
MDPRQIEAMRITNQDLRDANKALHEMMKDLKLKALRAEIRIGHLLSLLDDADQLHEAVELG